MVGNDIILKKKIKEKCAPFRTVNIPISSPRGFPVCRTLHNEIMDTVHPCIFSRDLCCSRENTLHKYEPLPVHSRFLAGMSHCNNTLQALPQPA